MYGLLRHRNGSVKPDSNDRLTNVVFMGMGEPFYNYDQVIKAAQLLHDQEGLGLGARHITISTAGVVPGIDRFTEERQPYNLAISLNHSDPDGRLEIMDITEKYSLDELLQSVRHYSRVMKRRITFEYVMIPDKNMGRENLRKLIDITRSVDSKINLIPLNTNLHDWRRPSDEEM
ncbi:MAG: radical SAM protein, partial [Spirochaetia bacterium]|nr:radical SAM protein [Spirochaetia bacterium]